MTDRLKQHDITVRHPFLRKLLPALVVLLLVTSGVLGYQLGLRADPQRQLPQHRVTSERVFVSSLQPYEAPTTGFERISVLGSVRDQQGMTVREARPSLRLGDKPIDPAYLDGAAFAWQELDQGDYHLDLVWPEGQATLPLSIRKSERAGTASLDTEAGGYLLTAYPSTGSVGLDILLQEGQASLRLTEASAIGLQVYQLWDRETPVHIFTERLGNQGVTTVDDMNYIAPGSRGTFIFAVENTDRFPLEYRLSLRHEDESSPALPLTYRLLRDVIPADKANEDDFLTGPDWLSAEEVLVPSIWIPPQTALFYTLEWRWHPGDDLLDTAIGSQPGRPLYRLWIEVRQTIPLPDALHG